MTTEQEIIDILKETRIDWEATPPSVVGPLGGVIRLLEDFGDLGQRDRELVGYGYFFVNVSNMSADLALMRCTRPSHWETELIPQELSPLLEEDLERAVEEAGGALNWSGYYPLDGVSLWKVRHSYLGG